MKHRLIPITALTFLLLACSQAVGASKWGTVTFLVGEVSVRRGSRQMAARYNMVVQAGDRVVTGTESGVHLTKTDGGVTIKVTEGTELEIESGSVRGNTRAKLWNGGLIASVRKLAKSRRKVEFATPAATASIRGTIFSLRYSRKTAESVLSVFEGLVRFSTRKSHSDVGAGERATARTSGIQKVAMPAEEQEDPNQITTWDSLETGYLNGLSEQEKQIHVNLSAQFILQKAAIITFRDSISNLSTVDRRAAIQAKRAELAEKMAQIEKDAYSQLDNAQQHALAEHRMEIDRKRRDLKRHLDDVRQRIMERLK